MKVFGLVMVMGLVGFGFGQAAPAAGQKAAPLQLQTLEPATRTDPFPAVDPKNFTADTPTAATVDKYLHAVLGYDPGRIWRVVAIKKTAAPGTVQVTALVSERSSGAKVLNATFFVLPDGKHLLADGTGVAAFGADPYGENYALLKARADGPARGAAGKELMLVEFADLQCPHCKDAEVIMNKLAVDFPKARIVYENFPLGDIHPFANEAAAYGVCVAKSGDDKFFKYVQAVYDSQGALTAEDGQKTLDAAVTKVGLVPATVAACAGGDAAKARVKESVALGTEVGVNQTPMLAVNGRLLPLTNIPYETLKQVIAFQAGLDGVSGVGGLK